MTGLDPSADEKPSPPAGSGMIGMRERVVALSGKFAAGPLPNGGFGLQVEFPTLQRGSLMAMNIRVLLVDDHAVVREGYRRLIEMHQDIDVVAEAEQRGVGLSSLQEQQTGCRRRRYLDARTRRHRPRPADPPSWTPPLASSFSRCTPAPRTRSRHFAPARAAMSPKSSPPDVLVSAIRSVFAGRPALCAEINQAIATSRLCE